MKIYCLFNLLVFEPVEVKTPCVPSPCGANAVCKEKSGAGSCSCIPEYYGDPYTICRPECSQNSDCDRSKACFNQKCQDPCPGVCGNNALCNVVNHSPSCECLPGFTGNSMSGCRIPPKSKIISPSSPKNYRTIVSLDDYLPPLSNSCAPSPCGPFSICKSQNGHAICSCLPSFIGSPPACHPECVVSSDCSLDKACSNQKCIDPCPGVCGILARCNVRNHSPICSCPPDYIGDPFIRCLVQESKNYLCLMLRCKINICEFIEKPVFLEPVNPCIPSPCGTFSNCREVNGQAICSCLQSFVGRPPNCRPECTLNSECPSNRACINERCKDPCPGSCGFSALCNVVNHSPVCQCMTGYTGDPFSGCVEIRSKKII